jgi:hypothetical protein
MGRTPVRMGESLVHAGRTLVRMYEPAVHAGESLVRPGESLVRAWQSLVRLGESLVHAGESLVRSGEASPPAGESDIPACTGLHPRLGRDVSPRGSGVALCCSPPQQSSLSYNAPHRGRAPRVTPTGGTL